MWTDGAITYEGYSPAEVLKRRQYYDGSQYDSLNAQVAAQLGVGTGSVNRLKEHQRAHAYSDQIEDGIDFLADQIAGGLIRESDAMTSSGEPDQAERDRVNAFLDALWKASRLTNRNQEVARQVQVDGNLLCQLVPRPRAVAADPDEPGIVFRFWEVPIEGQPVYDDDDWTALRAVHLFERREWLGTTQDLIRVFELEWFVADDGEARQECVESLWVKETYGTDRAEVITSRRVGLPFIPFVHLHSENASLRTMFGQSTISERLMQTADRYNATRQLEFLAVRYNSFATAVVVGDMVHLQDSDPDAGPLVVRKDIGEFVTFPGGTQVSTLDLPTDSGLITSQLEGLKTSMFKQLGLQEIDPAQISSFGGVSGYALEILNRKSDGTFRRIVQNLKEGYELMIVMAFMVDAYARAEVNIETDEEGFEFPSGWRWWEIDPAERWPNQHVRVDFGSAYIVDEVAVRDDYTSGMISQAEALRKKGYSPNEVARIIREQEDEEEATASAAESRFSTDRG